MGNDPEPRRRRVAERMGPPITPLRPVAAVHHPALRRPQKRARPRAVLANSVLRLCLQNDADDLQLGRETIGLTDTDIEQITTLPRRTGEYATVYVTSPRGRGAVRVALGDLEYWIASSSDPEHDQPRRHQASAEGRAGTRGRRSRCSAHPTPTPNPRRRRAGR